MKKLLNVYTIIGISLLFIFLLLIVILKIDENVVTENKVGLSSINKKFLPNKTNDTWNDLTDLLLYFSLVIIFIFVVKGLLELFNQGSIFKVSPDILVLGVFVVIMIMVWIGFDKVIIINKRPYANEGSFPSTHVLIVTFISLYSVLYVSRNDYSKGYTIALFIISILSILLTFVGRVKAGEHWFTDSLGGLILGLSFSFLAYGILKFIDSKKESEA